MTTVAAVRSELSELYTRESADIERGFALTGDGHAALRRRTALVDTIVQRLWTEIIAPAATGDSTQSPSNPDIPKNFTLVATGGYGRGWLFPHSDIDLLFCWRAVTPRANLKIPYGGFRRNFGTCA